MPSVIRDRPARYLLGLVVSVAIIWLIALGRGPRQAAPLTHAAVSADAPLLLITEPADGVAPLIDAVNGAKQSVDLVIYELQDQSFEDVLVAAHARGLSVRVMLEDLGSFGRHPNQAAFDFLQASGVPVQWAPSYFALTHEKALVIDGALAYIMTFNLQPQYYATSRDFAIADSDPADASAIEAAFDADWNGREIEAGEGSDLVWSPGSADALMALITQATSTLEVYNEEMADPRIIDALRAAAARGVRVRVDMTYATSWKGPLNELVQSGVLVRTYASSAKFYIHAKIIIADGMEAFVGSENFSEPSLDKNRELGLLIVRPDIIASLEATFEHDWAGARAYSVRE